MTALAGRPRLGRFHVITDEVLQTRYSHVDVARLALEGGADAIQYREKRPLTTRHLVEDAARVAAVCQAAGANSIVDDRVDVAAAVAATGLHLGRDDLEVKVARQLLGAGPLIGGTANSFSEAQIVIQRPVDYLGVGPVFGTASKANPAPVMGLALLSSICAVSPVPVVAIGNITAERVDEVLDAGAYGIAVLAGVTCAAEPAAAARSYAAAIQRWLERRGGDS